jgi:DNA-nicking Smr family endonuclease
VRSLSPEETALWARVTSTIRPLSRDRSDEDFVEKALEKTVAPRPVAPRIPAPPKLTGEKKAPGATLDGSWERRISSGRLDPDRVVDLHGMTLDGAWRAIDRALELAIQNRERVLLLITGHQRSGEPPVRRGAIRAAVHDWLAVSRHSGDIAAVRGAHRRHGGGGSLYIVLRRKM